MMILIFDGHNYKYQVESLVKMFFPAQKLAIEYDVCDLDREDLIITSQTRNGHGICVRAAKGHTEEQEWLSDDEDDLVCREALCRVLYKCLCKELNTELSWGMLTGIRPVKRMHTMLEQGMTQSQVDDVFAHRFFVSKAKRELCFTIAEVQQHIEMGYRPNVFSLYISIPFCPTRCSYCSFVSQAIATKGTAVLMKDYVDKLCQELVCTASIVKQLGLQLETVYFGGGTPTSLEAPELAQIMTCIAKEYDLSHLKEYTVEAGRVDTITEQKLRTLKQYGVNRISINPQTFNDEVLGSVGRNHTVQDVLDRYALARKIGFDSINMDFIAGLPGDTLESFIQSIQQAISLDPENITVHTLTIKRSSDFYTDQGFEGHDVPQMVACAGEQLMNAGYLPYYLYRQKNMIDNLENVGYTKPNHESPYNIYIMEENQTILAVGAGSSTKLVGEDRIARIFNYKYPYEYCNDFEKMLKRKQEVLQFYEQKTN